MEYLLERREDDVRAYAGGRLRPDHHLYAPVVRLLTNVTGKTVPTNEKKIPHPNRVFGCGIALCT